MEFKNIEYSEGSHPICKFWLASPIDVRNLGAVEMVIAKLSDDMSRFDTWVVSKDVGRVYFNPLRKRVQTLENGQELTACVDEAIRLTKDYTRQSREENHFSNDTLRESVRRIVSEMVYRKLAEKKNK